MKKDNNVRLLWLTDIHVAADYENIADEEAIRDYLDSFVAFIGLRHASEPFDYILITGDLAFAGKAGDYKMLKQMLLDKLLAELEYRNPEQKPRVLTIPGNHDLDWSKNAFVKAYIDKIDIRSDHQLIRSAFLQDKHQEFFKLFSGYSDFLRNECKGKYAGFYQLEPHEETGFYPSPEYAENRLFGYCVDKKNKLVIVLLNSSWYSLGGGVNNLLVNFFKTRPEYNAVGPVDDEQIKEWLQIKERLVEYNTQITGIQMFAHKDLKAVFREYPDYCALLCVHHPHNWWEWSELYSFQGGSKRNSSAILLSELFAHIDVTLTGHEHVPPQIKEERLPGNVLHLKGGCLLEDGQADKMVAATPKPDFSKCWFSTLEISPGKKTISQKKYIYNPSTPGWQAFQKEPERHILYNGFNGRLIPKRRTAILDNYTGGTDAAFQNFLAAALGQTKVTATCLFTNETYETWLLEYPGMTEIGIRVTGITFWTEVFQSDAFIKATRQLLRDKKSITQVRFLTLDLFVDDGPGVTYDQDMTEREKVFVKLTRMTDCAFNVFRRRFFNHWEPREGEEKLSTENRIEFQRFSGMTFINHVIPYWIAEYYWI